VPTPPTNRALLAATLAAAALAPCAHALDPERAPSQYVVTRWGPRDLGSNTVHALLETPDHYLWLGTTAGLVRFDGARFIVFNARTHPGFGDGGVTALSLGPDGAFYLGSTAGAVVRRQGETLQTLHALAGPGYISAVQATSDGSVFWGQMGRAVARLHGGQVGSLTEYSGVGPAVMAADGRGGLWFGTRRDGLFHFDGHRYRRREIVKDAVQALHVDRAGALWVGTPHGLLRLSGDRLTRYGREDGLAHDSVSAILEDRHGNVWIGTSGGGLSRLTDGHFARLTASEGLSDDDVRSLLEDHEGNLWVGTADGLSCLSDGRFVTYGRLEGLRDPAVSAVARGLGGSVWIGTMSGVVARLQEGRLHEFPLPGGLGRDAVIALAQTRDGDVWASVDNGRLFHITSGGTIREETPHDAGDNWKASAIYEDEQGVAFFVHGAGLSRLRGGKVVRLHPDAPSVGYVHEVFRDRRGTLWLGSSVGLVRVTRDGVYRLYGPDDGLRARVRSICEDADGSLWLATSAGLVQLKDDRFRALALEQGLPENYLRLALDDGRGFLWLATMGQLLRVDKREIADVFAGRRTAVTPVRFDTTDGLRSTDAGLSSGPGFRDVVGRLWFATNKGAAMVDPARLPQDEPGPPVILESVVVDGRRGDPATISSAPPQRAGRGEVTIEYTALSYRDASHVRFRHRLEGLDHDWVEAGSRRSAYYSTLPPGQYRFVVAASNAQGAWNGPEAHLSFAIRPPFYRTGAFYAACVGAFLALVAAAYRFRVDQMRARFAAIVDERTRIARELHDTLAQMLAAVGFQIDTAMKRLPEDPALGPLRRNVELAHSMVRSGLAEVRRSIWVLRAQSAGHVDDLASSLSTSLSQLTGDSDIGSTFTVTGQPRPLPPEVQRNLLRIAHEAVTNALRHAQPRSIGVTLHFESDGVCLRVNDDGCGFERGTVRGEHFGLVGIAERARSMGGTAQVESRPGAGTEVACRVPYEG
jgi:signal transduction histidine kinase/ligand-binding sensor domain-containing protein